MKFFRNMYINLAQQASAFNHNARNEVVSATIGTNEYICYTENCSYTPTYDANGNITEYIDEGGNVVAQYQYSAFGEIISQSGESFTHRFSTKPYCTTIGLVEYQFRKYDPVLGRWLSRDPIEEAGGLNLYAFCENNGAGCFDIFGTTNKDESRKYSIGFNGMPKIVFDNDFPYDENLKPTTRDYFNYLKWNVLVNGAVSLCYIEDATEMYSHYLDGSGTPLQFDYVKAYNEDLGINLTINTVILEATNAAESLAKDNISDFYMSSTAKVNEVYPQTQNWQKTIGWHYIWGEAYVRRCNDSYKMLLTINAIDKYNFNKGQRDISTGAPDNENGRFESLGWAKSFITRGRIVFKVSWEVGSKKEIELVH